MNNINVGDIVRYDSGHCYGFVVKYMIGCRGEDDSMLVIFFHKPEKTYHYYLSTSMKSCWEKVE